MKRVNYMVGKPGPGTDHAKGRDSGASPAGAGSFVCGAGSRRPDPFGGRVEVKRWTGESFMKRR